jgi:hypothetical protein
MWFGELRRMEFASTSAFLVLEVKRRYADASLYSIDPWVKTTRLPSGRRSATEDRANIRFD